MSGSHRSSEVLQLCDFLRLVEREDRAPRCRWPASGQALALSGLLSVLLLAGCADEDDLIGTEIERVVVLHGVTSGDALPDAVILWSRVTSPDGAAVDVDWEIARDPDFGDAVDGGTTSADESRDFTVKLDVDGLSAATTAVARRLVPSQT